MPVSEGELKSEPSTMGDYIPMVKRRGNISVFLLKPTDACHNDMILAAELKMKSGGNVGENLLPSVEFSDDGSSGHLRFKNDRNYTFTLQKLSNNRDTDVVAERGDHFEELGNFAGRIQVQANDEVFDATRQKVCVLDKLAKEKQTKEIRQSGKGSSGHAKVNKIFSNLAKSTGSNQRPVTPIHSKRVSPVLSQSQKPSELLNKPKSESKGSGTKPKISPASHSSAISPVNSNMSSSVQPFPSISGRPLRQRIIQLLIVRPYSKAELLLRLQQDGLNDGDKTKFSEILTEVCQSKGNDKWGLNRSFYHEVDLNWPAYDAYNKSVVKRNLEAVQTLSEGGGSGANGGGQNPLKRAKPSGAYEDEDCIPGVKLKKSSSHQYIPGKSKSDKPTTSQQPQPQSEGNSQSSTTIAAAAVDHHHKRQSKSHQSSPVQSASQTSCATTTPTDAKVVPTPSKDSSSSSNTDWSSIPDFMDLFPPVKNGAERQKYREEFDNDYEVYLGLHKQLEEKSKKFVKFKKQLEGLTDRDGDEYRRIEREICEEYDRYERDEKIQEIRARHKWLQTKLEVVKKRVVDYDQGESIRSATLNLPSTPAGQQQQHQRAHDDITVM